MFIPIIKKIFNNLMHKQFQFYFVSRNYCSSSV